jgi:pseudoazurin
MKYFGDRKLMSINKSLALIVMFFSLINSSVVLAESHTVNAEARRFNADIIYIQPGDTVGWINMTSHNTVTIEGMIPEGAEPWRSNLGQNLQVTLDIEGVYAYVCEPHLGFGMVGLIIVGEPTNLAAVRETALTLEGPYRRILGKLKKLPATPAE